MFMAACELCLLWKFKQNLSNSFFISLLSSVVIKTQLVFGTGKPSEFIQKDSEAYISIYSWGQRASRPTWVVRSCFSAKFYFRLRR